MTSPYGISLAEQLREVVEEARARGLLRYQITDALREVLEGLSIPEPPRPVDQIFDPKSERRDAHGNIIPWAKEHDYFMAFDPDNPDVPTD